MTDETTTLLDIKRRLRDFSRERDWEQFHHPKDLGLAVAIETGEVLEHFRFRTHEEIAEQLSEPAHRRELAHELADVLWALVRLADVVEVDLAAALDEKLALAAAKYPIDRCKGLPHKYTKYRDADSAS